MTLSGSTLSSVDGLNGLGPITGDLGSVSFSTGALMTGSLEMGGTFAAGGPFEITGNGTNGIPNGVLFSGTFSGPVSWDLVTEDDTHFYVLTGVVSGTIGGASVNGVTVQLTMDSGTALFSGSIGIKSGTTNIISQVPEPSALALLATGSLGMLAMMRRKLLVR